MPWKDPEIHRRYKNRRRLLTREKAVQYKGGCCQRCKQTFPIGVYDFHHTDPGRKTSTLAGLFKDTISWNRIKEELDKCILLCANCHRLTHLEKGGLNDRPNNHPADRVDRGTA